MTATLASDVDLNNLRIAVDVPISVRGALLESASAAIREAAGSQISRDSTTITFGSAPGYWLAIPVTPVVSVSDVAIDGQSVTGWRLVDGRLWLSEGWPHPPAEVTISVTYGYDPVPADIVNLACMLVAAGAAASRTSFEGHRGLAGVSVDDYSETYVSGDAADTVDPMEIPERTRLWLRARFGGGAAVVGARR
jgi:hypothetical protein